MADQPLPPVLFQGLVVFGGVLYAVWGTRVSLDPNHEIYGAISHNNTLYVVAGHPIQGGGGGGGGGGGDGGDGGGGDGGDGGGRGGDGGDGGGGDGGDGGGGDGNGGDDDPRPRKRSRRENGATATRAETGGP